jgi:hypothetical protein
LKPSPKTNNRPQRVTDRKVAESFPSTFHLVFIAISLGMPTEAEAAVVTSHRILAAPLGSAAR